MNGTGSVQNRGSDSEAAMSQDTIGHGLTQLDRAMSFPSSAGSSVDFQIQDFLN